jgi:predicted TIM-barrel fold metal-dependent hydrolase
LRILDGACNIRSDPGGVINMRIRRDVPTFLQKLHTDEFEPRPTSAEVTGATQHAHDLAEGVRDSDRATYWAGRLGTAAGLLGVNEQFDATYYEVPEEAYVDREAAEEALGGDEVVVDVQTHYLADRLQPIVPHLTELYRNAMPSWWKGLEGLDAYRLTDYLRCIFIETETAVACLTSAPGRGEHRQLYNDEIGATRRLFEEVGAEGRLLNHAVVHANYDDEIEDMASWVERYRPSAWKVYTMGEPDIDPTAASKKWGKDMSWREYIAGVWHDGWKLDDEIVGRPFLDRVRELARVGGPRNVCAHKGISGFAPTGSPDDVGPAARDYPDLNFIVYHSGYELMRDEEGAYSEAVADVGTNRLVQTVKDAGLGPGSNVYAELGSTWFLTTTRPREAAHVLGKLLVALGEDNVVWGTDGIYYGPTQQLVDSFRAFQIPVEMQEEFGYPALTPDIKDKILSRNAAKLYDVDLAWARKAVENDDFNWVKEAAAHYRAKGNPTWD